MVVFAWQKANKSNLTPIFNKNILYKKGDRHIAIVM